MSKKRLKNQSLILGLFGWLCFSSFFHAQDVSAKSIELENLQRNYQSAVDRAVAPIHATYIEQLKLLKERYTKAGNLQQALWSMKP
jgi:hypothetical protein